MVIIKKTHFLSIVVMVAALIILLFIAQYNYLLVHIIIEFGISTIGILIFTISIYSKKFEDENILILMGPGFLASALVGILHTIAYKGMFVFDFSGNNETIQLWIILSYILAITFLSASLSYTKKIKYNTVLVLNLIATVVFSYLVFTNNFPICYVEGVGLTNFKRVSEYVIIVIYIISLFNIQKLNRDNKINNFGYKRLELIIILLILAESAFTLYFDLYGIFNILGHFIKFTAFLVMYDSFIGDLLINPYKKAIYNNNHDYLTGLFNRKYFDELLTDINKPENLPLAVVMFDINSLKLFNDAYGNKTGDEVLKNIANTLNRATSNKNYLARFGGDEFVLIVPNCSEFNAKNLISYYNRELENIKVENINVYVSNGFSIKYHVEESMDNTLTKAENDMNANKLINGIGVRANAVNAILKTLHEKNPREESHSKRVSNICYMFGEKLGLSNRQKDKLRMLGLLHDVGKIALDERILNKPGKLTSEEFEEIKKHPAIGYRILSSTNNLAEIAESVLAHHERCDGTGYPRGINKNEIPYLAKILTIVDSYDAMTSDRTYRNKMKRNEAVTELTRCSGTQFDPKLVQVFLELLAENENL